MVATAAEVKVKAKVDVVPMATEAEVTAIAARVAAEVLSAAAKNVKVAATAAKDRGCQAHGQGSQGRNREVWPRQSAAPGRGKEPRPPSDEALVE